MLSCLLAMADFFPLSATTVSCTEKTLCMASNSACPSLTLLNRRSDSHKGKERKRTPATSPEENDLGVTPKVKS